MTCGLLLAGVLLAAPPTAEGGAILDLPEDQEHRLEAGRQSGPLRVSKVVPGDYVVYLSFRNRGNAANIEFVEPKTAGTLVAQRQRGDTIYYAIQVEQRAKLPSAGSNRPKGATVTVIQRYKVDLPPGDKPFLDVADDQWEKLPSGALKGIVKVSKVIPSDYAHYLKLKKEDKITTQQRRGEYIYYAAEYGLDVPFPDGPTAWVFVTKRYIARVPAKQDKEAVQQ